MRIRRFPLLLLAIALCALAWLLLEIERAGRKVPNILLITLDTTRKDHLSCYGYGRRTTPNLDRLAAEGQRFDACTAVSSWTLPAHASLFTGLTPAVHGAHYVDRGALSLDRGVEVGEHELYGLFRANGLSEQAVTLAEVLKEAGYATGGVGAGPWLKPVFGLAQGFDFYDCNVISVAGRRADEVTALAKQFLRKRAKEPFFLFLNYFDPHGPYTPPRECAMPFLPREDAPRAEQDPGLRAEMERALYDGEIAFMDREIGRLLDFLKAWNLYDDTWILVVGDHGEQFGDHGLRQHGHSLYEGETAVPFLVKYPAGWTDRPDPAARVSQADILPFILDRLGIPLPGPVEGRPPGARSRGPVTAELHRNEGVVRTGGARFDRNLSAVWDGGLKLIRSSRENDPDAGLFDLAADPDELHDLGPERPGEVKRLEGLMEALRAKHPPPLPPRRIQGVDAETERQLEALGYGK